MSKGFKMGIIAILISIPLVISILSINKNKDYGFSIYFFDAGKADCMLISNNDNYIMIDTGEEDLEKTILSYLKNNNISKLDYLILTHFDKDHIGSAGGVIKNVDVANVFQSNVPKESKYYDNYIEALQNKGIAAQTIEDDKTIKLGDMNIVVNGTDKVYGNNESNNSSLIVSVNYKDTNYLFMGDAQNARIKDYISEHTNKYDLIKIPYHGHYQKRLEDLINVVSPKMAVITSSTKEPEDSETIELLNKYNIACYLTRNGAIEVLSNGTDINVYN